MSERFQDFDAERRKARDKVAEVWAKMTPAERKAALEGFRVEMQTMRAAWEEYHNRVIFLPRFQG